jgi:hypothetical protein
MNRTEETSRLCGSATIWLPAVVGILAVVPFAFLELVNRRGLNEASHSCSSSSYGCCPPSFSG